jgi:hypothetical protein
MAHVIPIGRRVLWLAFTCVLLLVPRVGWAQLAVYADFDGDGRHDPVTLDRSERAVRVWLSRTGTTDVIGGQGPLLRVIATDLDGDRRPELVASDTSTGLHVWKIDGSNRFRSYPPLRSSSEAMLHSRGNTVDDAPLAADDTLPTVRRAQEPLGARAVSLVSAARSQIRALQPDRVPSSTHGLTPSTPRAPPPHIG